MGFFSKLAKKVSHHAKRHYKGWLTGGILDPTVQRHHKSLFKGNWFNSKKIKPAVNKYLSGVPRHGFSAYATSSASDLANANAFVAPSSRRISDLMR